MTIRRGETWGEVVDLPTGVRVVDDDLALHQWVVRHRAAHAQITEVGLRGGDLARTCGGGTRDRFAGPVVRAPIDVLRLTADPGTPGRRVTWAVAHVVARRSWWRGEVVFVMNAEFYGDADVAPRAHPNDGKADLLRVSADTSVRTRWVAARRATTGTHVPHPQLSTRHAASFDEQFARPLVVWVDGQRWGTASRLQVVVEPDAVQVYL